MGLNNTYRVCHFRSKSPLNTFNFSQIAKIEKNNAWITSYIDEIVSNFKNFI